MVNWPNQNYEQPMKVNLLIMVILDRQKYIYSEDSTVTGYGEQFGLVSEYWLTRLKEFSQLIISNRWSSWSISQLGSIISSLWI